MACNEKWEKKKTAEAGHIEEAGKGHHDKGSAVEF
jgi:hypothetical protein